MAEKQSYEDWRAEEIKRVGLDVQLKAERDLDRDEAQPIVEFMDDLDGKIDYARKGVVENYQKRGRASKRKIVSMPSRKYRENYDKIDWS